MTAGKRLFPPCIRHVISSAVEKSLPIIMLVTTAEIGGIFVRKTATER